MRNKKPGIPWVLALLSLFISIGLVHAEELYVNELFEANPPVQVPKEGPVVRVKQPEIEITPPVEELTPAPEPAPASTPLKKVALTFDDGPDLHNTPKILDILKTEEVLATFFVVGNQVERYPEMVMRMFEEGHLIANHSRTHTDFDDLTNEEIITLELGPTSKAVEQLTGYYPMVMRPPYGSLRIDSVGFLRELGWRIVRWSLDTFDWDSSRNKPEQILGRIQAHHHANAIILMHCNGPATTRALPGVIKTLRELGYEFVTVSML